MSVDKSKVREDYLKGLSVRALAAKYGVPKSTVNDWVKKYGWVQEGKPHKYVSVEKMVSDALSEAEPDTPDTVLEPVLEPEPLPVSENYKTLREYARKVLKKADDLLDLDDALAPRDLKSLSSMLLDVRTLLNTLSPLEEEERRLRLAALKKQAQEEQKTSAEVTVRFVGDEVDNASS